MGVLAAGRSEVPMQVGTLTADAGTHQLYLAHQARREDAAPVYKALQAGSQLFQIAQFRD